MVGRSKSSAVTAAARARISSLCLRGSAAKRASASSAAFSSGSTAASPSARPRASSAISATFWSAKARPSTGTSAGSSRARSCGTCCREVEEATDTAPSDAPGRASRVFRAARTSARHTLRPFTIPATRCTPAAETDSSSAFEYTPCTRSRCNASTPVPSSAGRFSRREP